MSKCGKCGLEARRMSLVDGVWLCDTCYPFMGAWSKTEKIKSRARMPDGKVLQGRDGQKIMDKKLKDQNKQNRYQFR